MEKCPKCKAEVAYVSRWRVDPARPDQHQVVMCEVNFDPARHYRESFVEVAMGEFVSVFRHQCPKEEPFFAEKRKPKHQVFKGDRKKFPATKSKKQTEMDV